MPAQFFPATASSAAVDAALSTFKGGASSGEGVPTSLEIGEVYLEMEGGTFVGVWIGTVLGPEKAFDGEPIIYYGTGASRPLAGSLPDAAFFVVTDALTVPAGMYQNQGGVWVAIASAAVTVSRYKEWQIPGVAAVNATDWDWVAPANGAIQSLRAYVQDTPPNGQDLIVDVELNGSTLYPTTPSNRPKVPKDTLTGPLVVPDTTNFTAGDRLRPKITQVGVQPSGIPVVKSVAGVTGATGTTRSVARATGAATGNLQIIGLYGLDTATWTPPGTGNWVSFGSAVGRTGVFKIDWYYRLDDGTAGPWVFTSSATAFLSHMYVLLENVNQTTPINTASSGTGKLQFNATLDTNISPGSLTTTVNDVLEIAWERTQDSVTVNPGPGNAGYTVWNGFSPTTSTTNHIAAISRPTAGTFTGPTSTSNVATTSAIARIAVVGSGTPPTWSPGKDVTVAMRYLET